MATTTTLGEFHPYTKTPKTLGLGFKVTHVPALAFPLSRHEQYESTAHTGRNVNFSSFLRIFHADLSSFASHTLSPLCRLCTESYLRTVPPYLLFTYNTSS